MAGLEDLLSLRALRRVAGTKYFQRGKDYCDADRVKSLVEDGETIAATVMGQQEYSVRLWAEGGQLGHTCTCPIGETGAFCKHCVAAGLAFLRQKALVAARPAATEPVVTMDDVRACLLRQDREWLVDLLVEQLRHDESLHRRLLMRAAKQLGRNQDLEAFVSAIDDAVFTDHLVEYREMWDYTQRIDRVMGSISGLLGEGYASEAMALCEYFLDAVYAQIGMVDDSDGQLGGILHELRDLHHEACLQAKPDPRQLARRLFRWETTEEYDVFSHAVRTYADVLGEDGRAAYRELAEARWSQVPPLGPGEESDERYGERHNISRIMESLARDSGDVDAVAAVLNRDLADSQRYLKIAQVYRDAGQTDRALEWAERGLREFPQQPGWRLREFAAEEYHRRGWHGEAVDLAWAEFVEGPGLEEYKLLRHHAALADDWPEWRGKALSLLREAITREKTSWRGHSRLWGDSASSALVRIYLWEDDAESAWRQAQETGCGDDLWLELAARREGEHPEDALPIYQARIEPIIEARRNDAYERAFGFVRKVKELMGRLGRQRDFEIYLEDLKARHRRLRNLMALLREL